MNFIEFPNMGLRFEMVPQLFTIGPFSVHWYGIITALAFLVIVLGVLRSSPKYDLSRDDLIDMMLITTPIGIIFARLFYVFVNWQYYAQNPEKIYRIWEGGLAIYGGIVAGIITIYLFCRYRKIDPLKLLDHLVVYLVLGQAVGRWGNFVNQELFGPNTDLPWGMTGDIIQQTIRMEGFAGVDPMSPVHPLFLYESLWSLGTFFILLWFRKRKKLEGEVFFLYMIFYGGARFTIDSLRFDLMVGNVNINRLFGFIFILAFGALLVIRRIRLKHKEQEQTPYMPSAYRNIMDNMRDEPTDKSGSVDLPDGESDSSEQNVNNEIRKTQETAHRDDMSKSPETVDEDGVLNKETTADDDIEKKPENLETVEVKAAESDINIESAPEDDDEDSFERE